VLYQGAHSTKLAATMLLMNVCQVHVTMLLMNVCQVHGVSSKSFNELLALLLKHLFPRDNCLPSNMYQAKMFISKVGLKYENIDAFCSRSNMRCW
jgi:hypothetical protein